MKLHMSNGVEYKSVPIGFSWTTFFFGCLPALFRTDWKWFLIQAIAMFVTSGLSVFVFAFIYNKIHVRELLEKGFKVQSVEGGTVEMARMKLNFVSLPQVQ